MKLRPYSFLLLLFVIFSGCDGPKEPELTGIENVRITRLDINSLEVTSDAVFHNPNPVSCLLNNVDIEVKLNGIEAGTVKQTMHAEVPANADFRLPIKLSVPPQKIYSNWGSLIIGILAGLDKKELQVDYKGKVILEVAGIEFEVPVEESEKIPLRK